MAMELKGYREELAYLAEIFPDKTEVCVADIIRGLKVSKKRATTLVKENSRNGKYLTLTELARARL